MSEMNEKKHIDCRIDNAFAQAALFEAYEYVEY